jgi:CspA family cold shock protein
VLGVVTKIISEKGIGFIKPCGRGRDVFFHYSVLVGKPFEQLTEGQAVTFDLQEVENRGDRPRAARVEPCDQKMLGRTATDEQATRHPRASGRKPNWRK